MDTLLRELNARLDELESNVEFIATATSLRPRLGAILNWGVGGDVVRLAQSFLDTKSSRAENLYAALLLRALAAFERFARQFVDDTVGRVVAHAGSFDSLAQRVRDRNIVLTGRLLASLEEPREHLVIDPGLLAKNLSSCVTGNRSFQLNAAAFAAVVVSGSPTVIERALRNLDIENWWDAVGNVASLQQLLGTAGPRATGTAAAERLKELWRSRNLIAHAGDGETVVTESDVRDAIRFVRTLAIALEQAISARLR